MSALSPDRSGDEMSSGDASSSEAWWHRANGRLDAGDSSRALNDFISGCCGRQTVPTTIDAQIRRCFQKLRFTKQSASFTKLQHQGAPPQCTIFPCVVSYAGAIWVWGGRSVQDDRLADHTSIHGFCPQHRHVQVLYPVSGFVFTADGRLFLRAITSLHHAKPRCGASAVLHVTPKAGLMYIYGGDKRWNGYDVKLYCLCLDTLKWLKVRWFN